MIKPRSKAMEICAQPETIDTICAHVASGGTLPGLCEVWGAQFGYVVRWVHADETRDLAYRQALSDRGEWEMEKIFDQLRAIALTSPKDFLKEDGSMKDPKDWPEQACKALASLEVDELIVGEAKVGLTKKFKQWDKLKAIELLGKDAGRFVQKVAVGVGTLEDLVAGSMPKPAQILSTPPVLPAQEPSEK